MGDKIRTFNGTFWGERETGVANGIAELGSGGTVPAAQIPNRAVKSPAVTANYSALDTDDFIPVDTVTASGAVTVTLPASPATGKVYTIADSTGAAGTKNIIIAGNGQMIIGAASFTLSADYNSLTILYNGASWSII